MGCVPPRRSIPWSASATTRATSSRVTVSTAKPVKPASTAPGVPWPTPVEPSEPNSTHSIRTTRASPPSAASPSTKARAARNGPTVCELDGPIPTLNKSRAEMNARSASGVARAMGMLTVPPWHGPARTATGGAAARPGGHWREGARGAGALEPLPPFWRRSFVGARCARCASARRHSRRRTRGVAPAAARPRLVPFVANGAERSAHTVTNDAKRDGTSAGCRAPRHATAAKRPRGELLSRAEQRCGGARGFDNWRSPSYSLASRVHL